MKFCLERSARPLRLSARLALAFFLWLAGPGQAMAAASPWLDHDQARLRLLVAGGAAETDGILRLGLQFELQPGWKVYWRTPGEAGFPPTIEWRGSTNLAGADMLWPAPRRFTLFGLDTFGYSDGVVLPIHARIEQPGAPVSLRAAVTYLICSEICIPHDGVLSLDLPAQSVPPSAEGFLISRAEGLVPGDGASAGLFLDRTVLVDGPEDPILEVAVRSDVPFEDPDVLVEAPPGFAFGRPQVTLSNSGQQAAFRLQSRRGPLAEGVLEGKLITLTVTDGGRAMEKLAVTRFSAETLSGAAYDGTGLFRVLLLAVLGGLILNLMPCVLPVLSIKLLAVVKQSGRDRAEVRIGFLASAAGIVFSFLVLATGAVAFKAAGLTVGWGMQFQQPLFLTAMALLLTLFACNLFGFFEIPLPAGVAALAGREQGHHLVGHFSAGAFATLLATPCSAPFLGTAVGFALARGAGEIFLIFAALGVGLAAPYLGVAAYPGLATRLPRPGPWMCTLRRLLAVALAGTALWLLTVLETEIGLGATLLAGGLLTLTGAVLWFGRRWPGPAAPAAAAVLALGVLATPAGFGPLEPALNPPSEAADGWIPFDEVRIAQLVAEGRVVFVDVTADWCLTCQVNKKLVIDTGAVSEEFAARGVVRMRGDWTLPSDRISDYLASFGRYGIPFNAVYGPGAPGGQALPELLSVEAVLTATGKAEGGLADGG
jgi:suppressor for copper-sensitivity B